MVLFKNFTMPSILPVSSLSKEVNATTAGAYMPSHHIDSGAGLVLSGSGKHPHFVLPCKAGGSTCDSDCANLKSLGICSHAVVVAHLNGQLS